MIDAWHYDPRYVYPISEEPDEIQKLRNEINGYKHDVRRLLEGEAALREEIERLKRDLLEWRAGVAR